jgi:5'-methylthioinosine phosphorylase
MRMLGIIGGTGLTGLDGMTIDRHETVATPWGEPSAPLRHGELSGRQVVFVPRHGEHHAIAPHEVNYRANVWALREVGVERVIAINAVGGIGDAYLPGILAVPHQLIDYSWGRAHTFFGRLGQPLHHLDFTEPYTGKLRHLLLAAGARAGLEVIDGGVYGVTQGPRLETAAEIDRLARDGCDLVGMTGMPEAGLAQEIGLEYACCAVIVNRAAGRGGDIHAELDRWLEQGMAAALRILQAVCVGHEPA